MRQWKIGTITAGLLLISLGVLWLGNNIWQFPIHMLIANAWPVLLIVLGLEVLFHQFFKKEEPIKFDGFSIFLVIVLGFASMIVYGVHSSGILPAISDAVNQNVFTEEIQMASDTNDINEIVIEIPNGEVTITGTESEEMNVDGAIDLSAKSSKDAEELFKKNIRLEKVGQKLIFKVDHPDGNNFFGWQHFEGTFEIEVPQDIFIDMRVINGEIQGDNLLNGSQIELVNGDIQLKNLAKVSIVENTNGTIMIEKWGGKLDASITNGDIEVSSAKVSGDIQLESVNGDVRATLPKSSDVTIQGDTNNGTVTGSVDWNRENDPGEHDYEKEGKLVVGTGQYLATLSSVNGDVSVDLE